MSSQCACRLCGQRLTHTFVDLGMSPLCESYVSADSSINLRSSTPYTYAFVHPAFSCSCRHTYLVRRSSPTMRTSRHIQIPGLPTPSGSPIRWSTDWTYRSDNLVVEVASNDGYLLQHFLTKGIPVLGVEPARNVAEVAQSLGIESVVEFLGSSTGTSIAERYGLADLVVANNVFPHVPDIRDFAAGLRALVKDSGVISLEFPHLLRLMQRRQFDTIYHEHYSYLSLLTASRALATAGLRIFDVDELDTHGGSLRVYARPEEYPGEPTARVKALLDEEDLAGLHTVAGHAGFAGEVLRIKSDLLAFLVGAAREGRSVAGYGAPGKGNTLLNHCGIREDLLQYTVDRSPVKQGKYLPGTHIPIYAPERLAETRPDYVLVLPWNLREEISAQLDYVRSWGARLVFPIPELEIV